jgi:hypothetical protein
MYLELEMVDFHQQAQLFEWRCPSRSRDAMTRDMCHIWETHGIHEQAVHGHWRNGMANKLDGSEDRFIDREARIFWDENNMAEVRLQVVKDTVDEFNAGRLPWCYKTVRSLIAPFPKTGHMDEYKAGQSDEGEPDCSIGACWDDGISSDDDFRASRKRPSSSVQDDSGTCKNDAPRSRARDKIAPAEEFAIVPYDPHPTPNPQEAIAEVANSLANMTTRCEDLLRSAKTLGSVPIQQAARRELRRLQKKARGPWRERATVKVTMAHLEDRTAFDGHLERTRARMLKDEEQRLTEMSGKLKKREAKLGRARAKVKAAISESGSDGSHDYGDID